MSLFGRPGVGNRPPSVNKITIPRGCARGGMVTGRIELCITCTVLDSSRLGDSFGWYFQGFGVKLLVYEVCPNSSHPWAGSPVLWEQRKAHRSLGHWMVFSVCEIPNVVRKQKKPQT